MCLLRLVLESIKFALLSDCDQSTIANIRSLLYLWESRMDFIASGKTINNQDIYDASVKYNIGMAEIKAVLEVEAAGRGSFKDGRLKILFEPHIFYQQLGPGSARELAVKTGVAYEKWGTMPYPKSSEARYQQLAQAMNIDITKALRSASWGLPQIVGYNYAACGYGGIINMIDDFKKGEREQLFAFLRLIKIWQIDDDLREHNWKGFARRYNGPGYAKNGYDDKLKAAYKRYSSIMMAALDNTAPADIQDNDAGSNGDEVMNMRPVVESDVG